MKQNFLLSFKWLFKNTTITQIVIKNSIWFGGSQFLARMLKFFLIPFITRLLGPESYGQFMYTISLMVAFFMFSDVGISSIFIREYQKQTIAKRELLASYTLIKILLGILAVGVGIVLFFFIDDPGVIDIYFYLFFMTICDRFRSFLLVHKLAQNHEQYTAIGTVFESVGTVVFSFLFLWHSPTVIALSQAYLLGSVVALGVVLFLSYRDLVWPGFSTFWMSKYLVVNSLPYVLITSISLILATTDTIMIKHVLGLAEVGFYEAALRPVLLIMVITTVMSNSLTPVLSEVYQDLARFHAILTKGVMALLLIVLPISVGGMMVSQSFISILFGSTFSISSVYFAWMIFYCALDFPLSLLNCALMCLNKHRVNTVISSVAVAVNITLNLLFIHRFGVIGVIWGTLAAKIVDLILTTWYIYTVLGKWPVTWGSLWKCVIATGIMAGIIGGVQAVIEMPFVLLIMGSAALYGVLLWMMKESVFADLYGFLKKRVSRSIP